MATEAWLAAVVLAPLGLAAALLVRPLAPLAERLAPLGALPALLAALLAGDGPVAWPDLLLGTVLRLGPATRPLLLLVGLILPEPRRSFRWALGALILQPDGIGAAPPAIREQVDA